ncbi:MAG: dehydratase [Deltaproteobacteria bacterium]|nr:dehydratase [Deltaproteobacteria bacterium]
MTEVMSPEAFLMQVHGEQDMHFHRPLIPGATLTSWAEPHSVRVGASGARYTVRVTSVDTAGRAVLEQYATFFIRGMTDGPSAGPDKPDHVFPEEARRRGVGEYTSHVDADQTYRYRDASGDPNPIHFDEESAKAVGLPGIIVHGLCTMAMTGRAIVETLAGGDPSRLTRLAVRFSTDVFPGTDLVTHIYDVGERDGRHVYAFEAVSLGRVVISNGRAEVKP